jgi:hypothetical protein
MAFNPFSFLNPTGGGVSGSSSASALGGTTGPQRAGSTFILASGGATVDAAIPSVADGLGITEAGGKSNFLAYGLVFVAALVALKKGGK